jgi:hypothetical protein
LKDYRAAFRLDGALAAALLIERLAADLPAALAEGAGAPGAAGESVIRYARRGLAWLLLGREDEARRDFGRFLALSPEDRSRVDLLIRTARQRRGLYSFARPVGK